MKSIQFVENGGGDGVRNCSATFYQTPAKDGSSVVINCERQRDDYESKFFYRVTVGGKLICTMRFAGGFKLLDFSDSVLEKVPGFDEQVKVRGGMWSGLKNLCRFLDSNRNNEQVWQEFDTIASQDATQGESQ